MNWLKRLFHKKTHWEKLLHRVYTAPDPVDWNVFKHDGPYALDNYVRPSINSMEYLNQLANYFYQQTNRIKPGSVLHFKLNYGGMEYQTRIFLGDPVTLCEITFNDGKDKSFAYTKRNPKDTWNAKVAITTTMRTAISGWGLSDKSSLFYEKLFKKYPELRGK